MMETNKEKQQDVDNVLIISSELDSKTPDTPTNEEVTGGYNSANDTGNTNEDLELSPNDDPETNIDEYDLEALNGEDIEEDEID